MSVEDAFLKDIIENAGDDAPRLVYADWLEDRGDSESAEFIRLQCRLAGLDAYDPARGGLERREYELLRAHGKSWGKAAARFTRRIEFRRGFVGKMTLAAKKFLANAEAIFARVPLTELRLLQAAVPIEELARCEHLARLRVLDLHSNPLGVARISTLVGSKHLANLHELNLGYVQCRAGGVRAVLRSPNLGGLRRLSLNSNNLRDADLEPLVGCTTLPQLRALNLGGNALGAGAAEVLTQATWLGQLAELDLHGTLAADAVVQLISSERWANLRKLNLSNVPANLEEVARSAHLGNLVELHWMFALGPSSLAALAAAPRLPGLRVLDLRYGTPPTQEAVRRLVGSPLAANLREFRAPPLSQDGVTTLLAAPALAGLVTLDLTGSPAGGAAIVRALRSATHLGGLRELGLSRCHIGSEGLTELASCPHLAGVSSLDLSSNGIHGDGFEALIASPHLRNLRRLALWDNPGAQPAMNRRLIDHFGEGVCEGISHGS